MNEYIKKIMSRWIDVFSKRIQFENHKNGFNESSAQMALLVELMKEQVPREDTRHTTR